MPCTTTADCAVANTTCVSGACVFFYDGFEDGTYDRWTPGTNPATFSVVTTTPAQGADSLLITGGGTEPTGLSVTLPAIKPTYVGWYVRSPTTNVNVGYVELTDAAGNRLAYGWLGGAGKVSVEPGVSFGPVYQADTWVHIEFKSFSWTTGTFDIYVDGALVESGGTLDNFGPTSAVSKIVLFNTKDGVAQFDDILVK